MNARVQENLNLSKRLSEVKSPLDVHAAFADYWQMVTAHYQSAVTKSVAEVKSETKDVASAVQQSNGFRSHRSVTHERGTRSCQLANGRRVLFNIFATADLSMKVLNNVVNAMDVIYFRPRSTNNVSCLSDV